MNMIAWLICTIITFIHFDGQSDWHIKLYRLALDLPFEYANLKVGKGTKPKKCDKDNKVEIFQKHKM